MNKKYIISIDPGREKCGIAVLSIDNTVIFHKTVLKNDLLPCMDELQKKYTIVAVVIGSGTTSKNVLQLLQEKYQQISIVVIDEYRTTDAAKKRYWQENPPKGIKRFIPRGMLIPPEPVDDWAAVIIGEKYLNNLGINGENDGKKTIKEAD